MQPCIVRTILIVAVAVAPRTAPAAEPTPTRADEELFQMSGLPSDADGLLQFFRQQGEIAANGKQIAVLVEQLGDEQFQVRERASTKLISLGSAVMPNLRQALRHPDIEVRRRAARCMQAIETGSSANMTIVAARLIRIRRPPGAVAVLLDYLPFATNEGVEMELIETLRSLGTQAEEDRMALARALKDKEPTRRAAAALTLGRSGDAQLRAQANGLLADDDAKVRLRAAQALISARDKKAVPVLVELLNARPIQLAAEAEDLLNLLAENGSPRCILGEDANERLQCRNEWAAWWKTHGEALDLDKLGVDVRFDDARRARITTRRFLKAWVKGDNDTLAQTTTPAFHALNRRVLAQVATNWREEQLSPTLLQVNVAGVVELKEYLRQPEYADNLESLKATPLPEQVVAVFVQSNVYRGTFFVRVSGGTAHVIALGMGRAPRMTSR